MFISPVSNFNVLTAQCMSAGDLKLCVKGKNDMPFKDEYGWGLIVTICKICMYSGPYNGLRIQDMLYLY